MKRGYRLLNESRDCSCSYCIRKEHEQKHDTNNAAVVARDRDPRSNLFAAYPHIISWRRAQNCFRFEIIAIVCESSFFMCTVIMAAKFLKH